MKRGFENNKKRSNCGERFSSYEVLAKALDDLAYTQAKELGPEVTAGIYLLADGIRRLAFNERWQEKMEEKQTDSDLDERATKPS